MNFTNDFSGDPDNVLSPIFLVDRGGCTFVTKVRNIEKAGGSLAVIIDDKDFEDARNVIMSDDGTGAGIRIPSMLISKSDGEILKNFLIHSPKSLTEKASLSAEFLILHPDDRPEFYFWYTSSNDKGLDFLKYFGEEMELFKEGEVYFAPKIVTYSCRQCDKEMKEKECVSDGRYCAMNHKGPYILGRDIIMEDLREVCLQKLLVDEGRSQDWWNYMKYVHSRCYDSITEDCSKLAHKQISFEYDKTMGCVGDSFERGIEDIGNSDNEILEQFVSEWKIFGSGYWPSAVINNRTFRGDLTPDNVFSALCAGFATLPDACGGNGEKRTIVVRNNNEGISGNVLIGVVVLLILINLFLIVMYRRCTTKEMNDDMQLQVNSAVSQYFALSTKNNP